MKRWHWASLALLGGIVAVTLIAVPRFSGGAQHAAAQQAPSLVLDMDVTNGDGPCDIIDSSRSEAVGAASYQIAVCLVDAPSPPASFNFNLIYNDTLNTCVPSTNLANQDTDNNPDANAGTTTFSTPSLGSGWDCTGLGSAPPSCDTDTAQGVDHGSARLVCFQSAGTPTLPSGQGVAAPIAEVTFRASAGGTDNMTLSQVAVADVDGSQYIFRASCTGEPGLSEVGTCAGGSDEKSGNTATPQPTATNTPTVVPSATPRCALVAGIEGLPTCEPTPRAHTPTPTTGPTETATPGAPPPPPPPPPPSGGPGANVIPPNTGQGTSGLPRGGSVLWVISAIAVASVAGGGLYLRRVRARR